MARSLLLLAMPLLLTSCADRIGDLHVCSADLEAEDQRPFSPAAWQHADASERGPMLADLARRHRLTEIRPTEVRELLGANTCYVHYDDEPCYEVRTGGSVQYLAFPVAHSGEERGKVQAAYLRSDPSTLFGCWSD